MRRFLEIVPILGLFFMTVVLVVGSEEVGYRWARKRKSKDDTEKEAPVGAMVGATLALLAFLLTFTFGIAADAYHARKIALVQEVSAIRLSYVLCDAIPELHRAEIRDVLRRYQAR